MYEQFFHFSELPFSIAPDPHFMFMSRRHQEGMAHLIYGIKYGGGFVVLTGEVGTGKTTLCRCLLCELPKNVDIALILNPKQNAKELLATICDELGISYEKQSHSLKFLIDALNHYLLKSHAAGRRTVVLLDEAQNLSMEVLEQIRLLTNLETDKAKLLQIILVGQPELKQILRRKDLRQLNQRVTARYHLQPLSLGETRSYIRHRLRISGGDPELFKNQSIREIYRLSKGIPRVINILCDRALLGAYAGNSHRVTAAMVYRAARETLSTAELGEKKIEIALTLMLAAGIALTGYLALPKLNALINPSPVSVASIAAKPQPQLSATPLKTFRPSSPSLALPSAPKVIPFDVWIADPSSSLQGALINAMQILGKPLPSIATIDCEAVKSFGLGCHFGKASWKDLMALNRPAIMEFSLDNNQKRYALLTGMKHERPVFQSNGDHDFSLADVLSLWNGYFLVLWEPPGDPQTIVPGQWSERVVWLRQQLTQFDRVSSDVPLPQKYDAALHRRVLEFQRRFLLAEDGVIGIQTQFYLDNLTDASSKPRLNKTD